MFKIAKYVSSNVNKKTLRFPILFTISFIIFVSLLSFASIKSLAISDFVENATDAAQTYIDTTMESMRERGYENPSDFLSTSPAEFMADAIGAGAEGSMSSITNIVASNTQALMELIETAVGGTVDRLVNSLLFDFSPNLGVFFKAFGYNSSNSILISNFFSQSTDTGNEFVNLAAVFGIMAYAIATLLFGANLIINTFVHTGEPTESPLQGLLKYAASLVLITVSNQLLAPIIDLAGTFYSYFMKIGDGSYNISVWAICDAFSGGFVEGVTFEGIGSFIKTCLYEIITSLINIIVAFFLVKELLKVFAEFIERYVITGIVYVMSPVAFAFTATSRTVKIFSAYLRMFFSELFLLVVNLFFVKGFVLITQNLYDGHSGFGGVFTMQNESSFATGVMSVLFMIAYLKVAQNFDAFLKSLGLNTAQSSGNIIDQMAIGTMAIISMMQRVGRLGSAAAQPVKAVGKAALGAGVGAGSVAAARALNLMEGKGLEGLTKDAAVETANKAGSILNTNPTDRMYKNLSAGLKGNTAKAYQPYFNKNADQNISRFFGGKENMERQLGFKAGSISGLSIDTDKGIITGKGVFSDGVNNVASNFTLKNNASGTNGSVSDVYNGSWGVSFDQKGMSQSGQQAGAQFRNFTVSEASSGATSGSSSGAASGPAGGSSQYKGNSVGATSGGGSSIQGGSFMSGGVVNDRNVFSMQTGISPSDFKQMSGIDMGDLKSIDSVSDGVYKVNTNNMDSAGFFVDNGKGQYEFQADNIAASGNEAWRDKQFLAEQVKAQYSDVDTKSIRYYEDKNILRFNTVEMSDVSDEQQVIPHIMRTEKIVGKKHSAEGYINGGGMYKSFRIKGEARVK